MRCVAYCTARKYRIDALANYLRKENAETHRYHDILHVTGGTLTGDAFIFPNGSMICWGLKGHMERELLNLVNRHAEAAIIPIEKDIFLFRYDKTTRFRTSPRSNIDIIELGTSEVSLKLAISFALSQSVKLGSYEGSVQETIEKNQDIPILLATHGRIYLSGKLISQRIGEIFLARSTINLQSEYLGSPEFFWANPGSEDDYLQAKIFLDIENRVRSLNQKLDVLQELLHMLNSQLQHRHSSLLEIIIILLILVEIFLSLFHWM